jgi:hypothetical protein
MPLLDKSSNISFIGGHGSLRFDASNRRAATEACQ